MKDNAMKLETVGHASLFGDHGPASRDGDVVYTPAWCAEDMVRYFGPTGRILEPCRGGGVFMRFLPPDAEWCEIAEGRDFFAWSDPVDWIITNPPYRLIRAFLKHALTVADNIAFLIPARNVFGSYGTLREYAPTWGGIAAIRWYGTGTTLGFPMGNAISAIHWKRGHFGAIKETFYEDDARSHSHMDANRGGI